MASGIKGIFGPPGYRTTQYYTHKYIFRDGTVGFWPGGGNIDVTKARDVLPSADNAYHLRPGTFMGKITSSGLYAPAFFGIIQSAITGAATSLTLTAAAATELVRRVGSTGTFTLTGPPAANGTARQLTVTYSAVNTTTGVVTITALNVNAVHTVNLITAGTGGSIVLEVQKPDGTWVRTPASAWSATDATLLSNLNTALDTATGVAGAIVATAIPATDTDLGFVLTYSGTGYAGNTFSPARVVTLFTSNTGSNVVNTTTGVPGAFAAGSLVGGTDGSQNPLTLIDGGYGLTLFTDPNDATSTVPWPQIPIFGTIQVDQLPYWPSDTGLKAFIRNSVSTTAGPKFFFSDQL